MQSATLTTNRRSRCGLAAFAAVCALAIVWFRLLWLLAPEWSSNPMYNYGWAVPALCAYMIWEVVSRKDPNPRPRSHTRSNNASAALLCLSCAAAYLPLRLIQEANPEWRLIMWSMAILVVTLTLPLLTYLMATARQGENPFRTRLLFPVAFFFVAVPWPSSIERPLIQGLALFNAGVIVEVLDLAGIPALRHGNIIEVATGLVGVEDACSGIRSFQAALMVSLFFGFIYRLPGLARILLCAGSLATAVFLNGARTSILSIIAAKNGSHAIAQWHDSTGALLLGMCMLCVWLLAAAWSKRASRAATPTEQPTADNQASTATDIQPLRDIGNVCRAPLPVWCAPAVLAIVLFAEGGNYLWYRSPESSFASASNASWSVNLPRQASEFTDIPFSGKSRQLLQFDEGENAQWFSDNARWQAIYLRWRPGRVAAHLARSHTPEACLTAAGHRIFEQIELGHISPSGALLPLKFYHAEGSLHVLYCLWSESGSGEALRPGALSWQSRLQSVLSRQRHCGHRSIELAMWSPLQPQAARAALIHMLGNITQPVPAFTSAIRQ